MNDSSCWGPAFQPEIYVLNKFEMQIAVVLKAWVQLHAISHDCDRFLHPRAIENARICSEDI